MMSLKAASHEYGRREIYKVVIDQEGRYDEAATSALRSRT